MNKLVRKAFSESLSGLYCMILIVIFVAFAYTEVVRLPDYDNFLLKQGYGIYLIVVSDVFLLYILVYVVHRNDRKAKVGPNEKSHGSATIRVGAIIFGVGAAIHFIIRIINEFDKKSDPECFNPIIAATDVAAVIFVVLQSSLIVLYPRLNLLTLPNTVDRFGTAHLLATNIIAWIRSLLIESFLEIYEDAEEEKEQSLTRGIEQRANFSIRVAKFVEQQQDCKDKESSFLPLKALLKSSAYLFPFLIEFVIIGATVAFLMWKHVGKRPAANSSPAAATAPLRYPHPKRYWQSMDWSHSRKGGIAGLAILAVNIANLCVFFGYMAVENEAENAEESQTRENNAEVEEKSAIQISAPEISKIINACVNLVGIVVLVFGIVQIEALEQHETDEHNVHETLDDNLLRITSFFSFLYLMFVIISGTLQQKGALHITNGVVEATQIMLQLVFLSVLKHKKLSLGDQRTKPGRQITMFFFLFNIAQWLVVTFEIQKVRSSLFEEEFFGSLAWILIQRLTLPLFVFFRFHSAVISIELWKEVYVD